MTLEEALFERHRGKAILLDTNLLVVLLAGSLGMHLFKRFDRVSSYSFDDYDLLLRLLREFRELITTPHILTEVSNLGNKLTGSYHQDWFVNLAAWIQTQGKHASVREEWTPAHHLAAQPHFTRFGITDCAILDRAAQPLVLTDDFALFGVLRKRNVDVINFAELRAVSRRIYRIQ